MQCRRLEFSHLVGKILWRRKLQPTPFLPGEFYGQRSLVGYGSWGCKELNMTEGLTHYHIKRWSIHHCCCLVAKSYLTLLQCHELCSPWDYSVHGIFQPEILDCIAISCSRDVPNSGIEPTSPASLLHCRWILYHWVTIESLGKPVGFWTKPWISE